MPGDDAVMNPPATSRPASASRKFARSASTVSGCVHAIGPVHTGRGNATLPRNPAVRHHSANSGKSTSDGACGVGSTPSKPLTRSLM